jgi:hypothetical protein
MTVYTVWEIVDDYPEEGGGEYLVEIFQKKEAAEKYCKELNNTKYPDNIRYEIKEMEVK